MGRRKKKLERKISHTIGYNNKKVSEKRFSGSGQKYFISPPKKGEMYFYELSQQKREFRIFYIECTGFREKKICAFIGKYNCVDFVADCYVFINRRGKFIGLIL